MIVPTELFGVIARLIADQKKILAVGTTVVRTLESLPALYTHLPEDIK